MLPQDLLPDSGSQDQFNPRPISLEMAFARQNDRIGYLRSIGAPWAEAVFQLRDLLVGIEDEEFFDGIPQNVRSLFPTLNEVQRENWRTKCSVEGWDGWPCRAVPGPGGRPVFRPTPEDLSHAYRIIMRLAARRGLSWRTKRVSRLTGPPEAEDAAEAAGATPDGLPEELAA